MEYVERYERMKEKAALRAGEGCFLSWPWMITTECLHPWLVGGGTVNGWNLCTCHPQVHRELSTMVHFIHQRHPGCLIPRDFSELLGSRRKLDWLAELLFGQLLHLLQNFRMSLLVFLEDIIH